MTEPKRVACFDCFSGASGDMVLGALVDAGLPLGGLRDTVARLGLTEVELRAEKTTRGGIAATKVDVIEHTHDHGHAHGHHHGHHHGRRLPDILELIDGADLPDRVKRDASTVFRRLAEAEAAVHDSAVEDVHFHEVGAVDAIVDIVGAAAGFASLKIDEILFSTLSVGRGFVECAHGRLPVPAPATSRLIRGFDLKMGGAEGELLTPTGAAILTGLGRQVPPPPMRIGSVGYGAGGRENEETPNLLRVWIGEAASAETADTVWSLETNVDDCSGEVVGYAMERLLAAGALDAYATPIQMKKGRPAVKLTVLCGADKVAEMEGVLFRETPTFGVRKVEMRRAKLARERVEVETPHGAVGLKVGRMGGEIVTAAPEYEDCRRLAQEKGIAMRVVMEAARRAMGT